jgi:hypothetical protein
MGRLHQDTPTRTGSICTTTPVSEPFPTEAICSACGQPHPPALIAFATDCRMVNLCASCFADTAALRAVAAAIRPPHAEAAESRGGGRPTFPR